MSGPPAGTRPDHSAALEELVGRPSGPVQVSQDAVNRAMIRHWVEAMGDANPVYVSDEAARAAGYPGVVAPPTMLQAWVMRGLRATLATEAARASGEGGPSPTGSLTDRMMALLDDEGLTSVVATNCEQTYRRPLRPGDRVLARSVVESISDLKRTALGTGRFVTDQVTFVAVPDEAVTEAADLDRLFDAGDPVATMRWRILKFRPAAVARAGGGGPPAGDDGSPPRRPRPALTQDNAFWFEGAREGKLLIQRCTSCGRLRHPPLPACGHCRSLEWDAVEASGRGELYSFVVVHHPQVAAFDYPLPIGLVALEEGTRLVANLEVDDVATLRVGMPVEAAMVAFDDELTLPVFRPAAS
ncbi:MAG: bifunctional MaoC family dehydratase N-terminal/OB-fold nucleic acid binding domain-containing protein [Acidimicrobiales bacterium]